MANMTAVTQQYGASRQAFLIVPLVSAFFLDLVNAILIPGFISHSVNPEPDQIKAIGPQSIGDFG